MVPGDYIPTQARNIPAVECPEVAQEERARASEKEPSLIFC